MLFNEYFFENYRNRIRENIMEPIVDITLEVSEGQIEHLKMYKDDQPTLVVDKFCKKFGLDQRIKNALESELNAQLQDIYLERDTEHNKSSLELDDRNMIDAYLKRMKKKLRKSKKTNLEISRPLNAKNTPKKLPPKNGRMNQQIILQKIPKSKDILKSHKK